MIDVNDESVMIDVNDKMLSNSLEYASNGGKQWIMVIVLFLLILMGKDVNEKLQLTRKVKLATYFGCGMIW